jgi:phosphoglycolate phosphatase-like HAD superfamily hydrolase
MMKTSVVVALLVATSGCSAPDTAPAQEATLSTWQDGPTRSSIEAFVAAVTDPASPDFVSEAERIAVFDNDGTLWSEQPAYFQLLFALDRVRALSDGHPEWAGQQPFQAAIDGDMEALAASGLHGILELVMASHAGMTTVEFEAIAADWILTARHPRFDRPFTDLVYAPMLELLTYLRAHGFKTFIVSGGGVEFMRPWVENVYGIPPEQVVGSSIRTEFELVDGEPVLRRLPEIDFIDDKAGKPVGIHKFIGRRPIMAVGNSDGDLQMLQWTAGGDRRTLQVLIHHTDAEREWAYDRDSHVGGLDEALDLARTEGWTVVDMANDWVRVFSFESN